LRLMGTVHTGVLSGQGLSYLTRILLEMTNKSGVGTLTAQLEVYIFVTVAVHRSAWKQRLVWFVRPERPCAVKTLRTDSPAYRAARERVRAAWDAIGRGQMKPRRSEFAASLDGFGGRFAAYRRSDLSGSLSQWFDEVPDEAADEEK